MGFTATGVAFKEDGGEETLILPGASDKKLCVHMRPCTYLKIADGTWAVKRCLASADEHSVLSRDECPRGYWFKARHE